LELLFKNLWLVFFYLEKLTESDPSGPGYEIIVMQNFLAMIRFLPFHYQENPDRIPQASFFYDAWNARVMKVKSVPMQARKKRDFSKAVFFFAHCGEVTETENVKYRGGMDNVSKDPHPDRFFVGLDKEIQVKEPDVEKKSLDILW
jgi:hypothetical protein